MSDAPTLWDAVKTRRRAEAGQARSASRHADDIARLVPVVHELIAKADRMTVSDLRIVAVQRGLLTGQETGRELSYLPAVMRAAGCEPTGEWVRSAIPRTHGNPQRVWRRKAA